jgi:hypothetical protein
MPKYKITVTETCEYSFEIDADDAEQAHDRALPEFLKAFPFDGDEDYGINILNRFVEVETTQ